MQTNSLKNLILLSFVMVLAPLPALSQSPSELTKRLIDEARRTNPAMSIKTDPQTGMPTHIRGMRYFASPTASLTASRDASGAPSDADILTVVEAFFATGELSAAFEARNPSTVIEATRVRKDPDIPTQKIVHVEQRVDGIPVFGSSGRVVVTPSLAVTQLTARFSTVAVEKTIPTITKEQAIASARTELESILKKRRPSFDSRHGDNHLERLRETQEQLASKATLVVYDPALNKTKGATPGPARLSWLTTVDDFRFFIDAHTGKVLFFYLDRRLTMPRRVYDLNQSLIFPGTKMIDETTGERTSELPEDADKAFNNTGFVRDFFADDLGRRTVLMSGNEGYIESYVRYGDLKNAHWCTRKSTACPAKGVMVFGADFASALDIAGHEITHGVISDEADLIYANESGAVNEALADIFGTLIEYKKQPGTANWVLAEDLPGFMRTSPLRSLANPNMFDQDGNSLFDKSKPFSSTNFGQPDHYSDYVQKEDPICETTSDYYVGCVHINSGIFNKFAFLIAEGGRHRGQSVKGIGRTKLERIAYRALTTHLTQSSGLVDSAEAFWTSCAELAQGGVYGFTSNDCDRVRDAQTAVGLISVGS